MPVWAIVVTVVGTMFSGAAVNYIVAVQAQARWEGAAGARLNAVEVNVTEIKDDQTRQWQDINRQGRELAAVQGSLHLAKGHHA